MRTYKAYFSILENTKRWALLKFITNSGLDIQTKVSSSFSPEEAVLADIIIVDEETASKQGAALSDLKKENQYFLPVLLLTSMKAIANADIDFPAYIDDVIFTPFSQTEWKRRITTYLHIREDEIKFLSREENEFKTLFTESHSIMFLIDPKTGQIEDVNPAACRFYGYTYSEFTRMTVKQINLLKAEEIEQALTSADSDKKSYFVFEHRLADGSIKTVEVYSGKVNHKGKPLLYSIVHDITEAKKTEKLLRESEEKYRSIFETSSDLLAITEFISGKYIETNDSFKGILGYTKKELLGKTSLELRVWVNPYERKKMINALRKKGFVKDMESHLRTKGGRIITGLLSAQLITLQGNDYILSEIRDITHLKKAEEALKEGRQLFETLANNSSTGVFRTDAKGKTTYVNPRWTEITGVSFERSTSKGWSDILPPSEKEELLERWTNNMSSKVFSKEMIRIKRDDGTFRWVLGHAIPEIHNGKFMGYVGTITDITDLVNTEQALRASENKYRSLAETSSDLIFTFDIDGKLTYLSPVIKKMSGYSADEILHRNFWEFIVPEYVQSTIEKFKSGISGEHIPLYEVELIHKSGKKIPVELNVTSLFDAEGNTIGRLAVARDITDRKKTEKALKESEARLRRFSQITKEGIIIHKNGIAVDVNQTILHMLGYSAEELIGKNIIKKLASPKYIQIINKNIKKEYVKPYDIEVFKKDGTLLPVEVAATNYIDINGETLRAVVFQDISQRQEMEKALRESEDKYRSLAEVSIDMILTYDLQGRITYVNPVVKEISGYTPEEVIGNEFINYISPEYVDFALTKFHKGKLADTIPIFELELIHKNGKKVPVELNPTSTYDTEGKITGSLSIVRDITFRKEAERKLLLRDKALNSAANAIIITNADGEIEWVNKAFSRLSGYSEEEAVGKFTIDLVGTGKQDKTFYERVHKILKSGQVWTGEFNDRRKDGTLYEVEEVITPVTDKNGKVEYLIGIMNDISERKAAERELRAAKESAEESIRLKSAFLANMNHEIRTPMNAVMGFSELMLDATPKEKVNYAKIVNNSAGQLMSLIDNVIFLSRLQSERLPVNKITFSPADLINQVFFMFDLPEMKKNLGLQIQLPEKDGDMIMEADADKIKQVLANFTSNAIKYTEKGCVKLGFEKHNNNILFFVEDSGMGIPKKEQQHIFEAFFRGRMAISSAIRGTGLGLNIAKELVGMMGGTIGVSSLPGKGSRFYFSLPYEPPTTFIKATSHKPEPRNWKELNILIAEDDETNYIYLDVLLKENMGRVDRAYNGKEAVEMVQKNTYDLILMDLKMPVMSGSEATVKIKKLYPHIPIIATTAYATAEEKERALDAGCDEYLSKPIKKSDLLVHIEKYLSGEH